MTKQFIYFENQQGGMGTIMFSDPHDLKCLYGWMRTDCVEDDSALIAWTETAEVGEMFNHRLGYCVRLKELK